VDSYDPRGGDDPRDRDSGSRDLSRGSRGGSDPRDRERVEPRDVFVDRVNLPRGREREHIRFRDRDYTLRGSESRALASVGSFRVIPAHDLRDTFDKPMNPRHGELWHLRDSGLVETVRLDRDTTAVTLTKEGRDLLDGWSVSARIRTASRSSIFAVIAAPRWAGPCRSGADYRLGR
jgi:hypothetical protein